MEGHYRLADSLLNTYGQQQASDDKQVQMYYELLRLERNFVHGCLNERHFSMADSLCRFYKDSEETDHKAKSQLFLGDIYLSNEDYPTALNCYLKAQRESSIVHDRRLLCLIARRQGDVYFNQRMLDESVPCYEAYYHLAVANHDTLRMAYGALAMGLVCTIKDEVDSILYYYNQAIDISKNLPQADTIAADARNSLCDIYIQLGEYDKALTVMPRNDDNDYNWAFWHYCQNHADSALYYFRKTLGRFKWTGEVEALGIMAEIEKNRGNDAATLKLYEQLLAAQDSLQLQRKTSQTLKTEAQYRFNQIKQERDKMEDYGKRAMLLSIVLFVILLLLLMAGIFIWKYYKQKRQSEMERLKRLDLEREKRYSKSLQKLEQNKRQIALLETQLAEERKAGNQRRIKELETDAVLLNAENRNIEAFWQKKRLLRENAKLQPIYQKVLHNVGKEAVILTDDDWQHIEHIISTAYPDFTLRLLDMARLKDIELRVCYLLKMEVQPSDIGPMVGRVKSTISMMCSRIYLKLTQQQGSSKDLIRLLQTL